MPEFRCRLCGQKVTTPDEYAGKRVRCPRCGGALRVPLASSPLEVLDPPERQSKPRLNSADEVADLLRGLDQDQLSHAVDAGTAGPAIAREQAPARGLAAVHVLGFLSLLAGAAAIGLCWLPEKRPYSIPIGVAGLSLAVVALMIASRRRGGGAPIPVAGAILSSAGILLSLLIQNPRWSLS